MMTAPGPVRPSPGRVAASARVLWVGTASEPWLALSRASRALGCESLQVSSLEAAAPELARLRPTLVLVHWRQVTAARGSVSALRARPVASGVPVALVVEANTPAEVLEEGESEGVEDCLLAPLRVAELRERLAALTGEPGAARTPLAVRYSPRRLLLAGASGPRAWGGLGALLEACGHHVLYCASVEGAAVRLVEQGVAPHLVLVSGEGPLAALRLLSMLRAQPLLEGVPALTVNVGPGTRAPGLVALLPRIHALLGREVGTLHAEERVPFCCPVEFGESGPRGNEWTSSFSSALSPGGLVIRTLVPARPGTAVRLRIHLPTTRERLDTHGVVAWANPWAPRVGLSYPYGMGVRFLGMGPPRLMHLRQLCQGVASL